MPPRRRRIVVPSAPELSADGARADGAPVMSSAPEACAAEAAGGTHTPLRDAAPTTSNSFGRWACFSLPPADDASSAPHQLQASAAAALRTMVSDHLSQGAAPELVYYEGFGSFRHGGSTAGTDGPPSWTEYVFAKINQFCGDPKAEVIGRRLFREGAIALSVLALEATLLENPSLSTVWSLLSYAQEEQGNMQQAYAAMLRARAADPDDLDTLLALAAIELKCRPPFILENVVKRMSSWLSKYCNFLKREPPPPQPGSLTADQLTAQACSAAQALPNDVHLALACALLEDATCGKDEERLLRAVACYKTLLRLRPDDYMARIKLGVLTTFLPPSDSSPEAADARVEEALSHFQEALALRPNLQSALVNAGRSETRLNQHERAASYFVHTLTLDPDNECVWGYLDQALRNEYIPHNVTEEEAADRSKLLQNLQLEHPYPPWG